MNLSDVKKAWGVKAKTSVDIAKIQAMTSADMAQTKAVTLAVKAIAIYRCESSRIDIFDFGIFDVYINIFDIRYIL